MVLDGDTSSAHHSQQGQEAGPGDPPRELLQGQKAAEELLLAARWAPICPRGKVEENNQKEVEHWRKEVEVNLVPPKLCKGCLG